MTLGSKEMVCVNVILGKTKAIEDFVQRKVNNLNYLLEWQFCEISFFFLRKRHHDLKRDSW